MDIKEFLDTGEVTIESGEVIAHQLKVLLDSEGWQLYRSIIERQQTSRFDQVVLQPLTSHDQTLGQEYLKGEIQGLRLALALPQVLFESATEQVRSLRQQREADESAGDQE